MHYRPTYILSLDVSDILHRAGYDPQALDKAGWIYDWNGRFVRIQGRCDYDRRLIEISKNLRTPDLANHYWSTLKHEVAHALCPRDGHGPIWKDTYQKLGGSGDRYSSIRKEDLPGYVTFRTDEGDTYTLNRRNTRIQRQYLETYRLPRVRSGDSCTLFPLEWTAEQRKAWFDGAPSQLHPLQ